MLTFLEHEANIWYGSNINVAARSTYKYVVTGVSCGGTLANPSRKHFIAALLKSLSILFGIHVITVSTGTATHINEMKARHAKGVILESEKDSSTHTLCMGLPTSLLCIHSIWRVHCWQPWNWFEPHSQSLLSGNWQLVAITYTTIQCHPM